MTALAIPCTIAALAIDARKNWAIDPKPAEYSLPSLPLALLLWFAVTWPSIGFWNSRTSQVIALVGKFSFSLHVVHVPILVAYGAPFQAGTKSSTFVSVLPGLLIAIVSAYVVYLLIERWTFKLPKGFSKK